MIKNEYGNSIKLLTLIVGLIIVSFVYLTAFQKIVNTSYVNTDFGKIYSSALAYFNGTDIYKTEISQTELKNFDQTHKYKHIYVYNLNPPLMVLFTLPFGLTNYKIAFYLWTAFAFLSILYVVYCLQNTYAYDRPHRLTDYLFLLFNFLIFFPTVIAFLAGQVTFVLLLLLVLGWQAGRRQLWVWVGFYFGLLVCLKLFFGLFFLILFLQRRWKAVGSYLATVLLTNFSIWLILGQSAFINYQKVFKSVTWYTSTWNISWYGTVARIFPLLREANYVVFPIMGVGIIVFIVGLLLALLGFMITIRLDKSQQFPEMAWDLPVAYATVAMLFLSPLGWLYYFPFYILPFFILWNIAKKHIHAEMYLIVLLLAAFFASVPASFQLPGQIRDLMGALIWSGFPFLGQLILLIMPIVLKNSQQTSSVPKEARLENFYLCYSMAVMPSLITWYKIFIPNL